MGDYSLSAWFFPVSCLLCWEIEKRTSCQKRDHTACCTLIPLCSSSGIYSIVTTAHAYTTKGLWAFSVSSLLVKKLHLRREASRCITSLLSATMISSTYLVVFWACLLCCDKNKDGKSSTVIRKCVEDQDTISVISYRFYLKDLRWTFKNCNS